MNTRFQVEVDGQLREAAVTFGSESDVRALTRWRFPSESTLNEPMADSLEYGRLAAKRWRYYQRQDAIVGTLSELRMRVGRNPEAELAMTLVVRPKWRSSTKVLGFAYARRTWCHHLVVDFLAVHPRVIAGRPEKIRRIGTVILLQLVALAEEIGVPCIWGEATAHSAPFYERALNIREVLDHFFIEDEVMTYCLELLRQDLRRQP